MSNQSPGPTHIQPVFFSRSAVWSAVVKSLMFGLVILMGGSLPPAGEVIRCPPLPQYNVLSSIKIGPKDGLNGCVLCVKCHIYFFVKFKKNKQWQVIFSVRRKLLFEKRAFNGQYSIIRAVFHFLTTWCFLRTVAAVIFFLLVKIEIDVHMRKHI